MPVHIHMTCSALYGLKHLHAVPSSLDDEAHAKVCTMDVQQAKANVRTQGYSALTLHEACALPEGSVGRKSAVKSVATGGKAVQAVAAQ